MFLGATLEVWTDVPNNPTSTTSMDFDPMLTPSRSLAMFECLVDAECGTGRCISGQCTPM